MVNTHLDTETPGDADLSGNPDIEQSQGLAGTDIRDVEAVSTIEGDTESETKRDGDVDPAPRSRGNT